MRRTWQRIYYAIATLRWSVLIAVIVLHALLSYFVLVVTGETALISDFLVYFYYYTTTATTVGYGDKAPITLAGRLLALVWMFAGLIMVASFTAAITSSLTVSNLQYQISGPQDLPGNTVATIDGTASAQYLQEQRILSNTYPDLHSAMQAVSAGDSDAVVYDRPLLQYRNQQLGKDRLDLLPGVFDQQLYALALPTGSPLRDEVNEAILRLTESPEWRLIQRAYLGEAP